MAVFVKRKRRTPRDRGPEKKKRCRLCGRKVDYIDYKDVELLQSFMSERAKMIPRRTTGNCAKHQRMLCGAIKRARTVALLPCTTDHKV
jgi:small subunit ribosomal protein S18